MESKQEIVAGYNHPHGITIWLDSYDDLFSDFDPREYDHRALSDDFLNELRKLVREDEDSSELQSFLLLIPANMRNPKTEDLITHRLHNYFRNSLQRLLKERRHIRINGTWLSVAGLLFLLTAGYISFAGTTNLLLHLLMITLEPAGWFFIWMGYDTLVNGVLRKKADLDFHTKMTRNKVQFRTM